jgi:hypothetical protein
MKKIISFSLWGNNLRYCGGAIVNAQLAQIHYPDWECWFYYDASVPKIYINSLNNFKNVRTILVDDGTFGAFWRFRAMQKDTIVISRDTDSRLSEREKRIVDEWLATDKKLSVIRDHTAHYDFPILAGMWGLKDGLADSLMEGIKRYWSTHTYLVDQFYLRDVVWPVLKDKTMVHGIKECVWMRENYKEVGRDFIGQTYDENENTIYDPALV